MFRRMGVVGGIPVLLVAMVFAEGGKRPLTAYGVLYQEWKAEVSQLGENAPELSREEKSEKLAQINLKWTPRFVALAKEHLDDDLWIDCLIWISVEGRPGPDFDAMFDLLRSQAGTAKNVLQLQLLMSELIRLQSDRLDPALRAIADNHHDKGLRGAALYALATRTRIQAERSGNLKQLALAIKLLEQVKAEYPDTHTYSGQNAENVTAQQEALQSPVSLGKTVPEVQGKTITGAPFSLREAVQGKVAVVSFSGHWCGPCVAMHAVQKEIYARTSRQDVVIIEINSDSADSLDDVRQKMASDQLEWTMIPVGHMSATAQEWHVTAWPTYFVIDAEGRIRRRSTGNVGAQLADWVNELVSEKQQHAAKPEKTQP